MTIDTDSLELDNPEFQNVWKLLQFTRQSVFLTGKAGTGKSTFLKYVCANIKKKYVVLAPTGIAAVNVGGQTMHSFFKLPFKPLLPDDPEFQLRRFKSRMRYSKNKVDLLKSLELIIIDEISMVRADVIDFIDKLLRIYTGNQREPFGGKQLFFVGDLFQLEPVVAGDMRDILARYYPNSFFFSAKAFNEISLITIELRKVYRQDDPTFVSLLDRMRSGSPTDADIAKLNGRLMDPADVANSENMVMTLATTRQMVDHINDTHLEALPDEELTYEGKVTGEFPDNSLPTSKTLTLKVGAQVVFIRNDQEHRWVNGTLGRITMADEEKVMVTLEDGTLHTVEPVVWHNIKYDYNEKEHKIEENVLGIFKQLPIKLAWALTIHKSQGLTFNNVIIDIGHGAFSGGQAYVALSRCRSLEGTRLASTINHRDVFVNPAVVRFAQSFNDEQLVGDALRRARADELYASAHEALLCGDLDVAFERGLDALSCENRFDRASLVRLVRRRLAQLSRPDDRVVELQRRLDSARDRFEQLAGEYVAMARDIREAGLDPVPAFANYRKALSIAPSMVEVRVEMATLYREMGSYDEAIAELQQAREQAPEWSVAASELAKTYFAAGALVEALDSALIAEQLDTDNPHHHDLLAQIYSKSGLKSDAAHHRAIARALRKK